MELVGLFALMWLIPAGLILPSRRLSDGNRVGWTLLVVATSWAGFLYFAMVAPKLSNNVIDELGRVHKDVPSDGGEHSDTGL